MRFETGLEDQEIHCCLTSDRDLSGAVLCFSGMAPMDLIDGGRVLRALGSYMEIALPDLTEGRRHSLTLRYAAGHKPANRAWLPLGPYLRLGAEMIELPFGPAGVKQSAQRAGDPIDVLPLVPQPQTWVPSGGRFSCDGVQIDHPALRAVADLATRQQWRFEGTTPITLEHAPLPLDAYTLEITPDGITLSAGSYGGWFYGGVTLLTLMQHGPLPCGTITDAPRFSWRGQHLDTARHYYEPDTILHYLDLMALLKLNRFHWHFADDEAFRLEVECLPELWQKTAFRGEGEMLPALFGGGPHSGGSYSKDIARRIIAHAKALNIEVMPEIEAPAHALALTTLYPDTLDPDDTGTERSIQGYPGNVLNPAQPRTWQVLGALAQEVGALFPFGHLHLGCDELPPDTWMGSPRARALMEQEGLETTQDLQGWTMDRLAQMVSANGQRPAAWEEAAQGVNGGIGNGAILFSWTGQKPGLDAARAGYDVVMCPAQHVYLDMAQSSDPDDWGASWAAFVALEDTIAWDPVPDPSLADRIIGVQGTFWSEFTTEDDQIWPMLMPRLLGVSAMAWQERAPEAGTLTALAQCYGVTKTGQITIFPC